VKPGIGWKKLSSSVWEHISGTRIHIGGLVKLPDGDFYHLSNWREAEEGRRQIAINGGNRRRGLMAWAISLLTE
jgi:hypothetical protein